MLLPMPIGNVRMNLYLSQYLDDIIPEMQAYTQNEQGSF